MPYRASGVWPAIICAIIFFWFGMMMANTLTAMMVPTSAPTWMNAPRPENTLV